MLFSLGPHSTRFFFFPFSRKVLYFFFEGLDFHVFFSSFFLSAAAGWDEINVGVGVDGLVFCHIERRVKHELVLVHCGILKY
jgi:hypothetical protein